LWAKEYAGAGWRELVRRTRICKIDQKEFGEEQGVFFKPGYPKEDRIGLGGARGSGGAE